MARRIGLVLGPALFGVMFLGVDLVPGDPMVTRMAGIALWMAAWWITEALPLGATAMLPLVLYPLLGIMPGNSAAPIYAHPIIFLFIGGFMIALAMEKWNLHKRIALWIIRRIGSSPSRLILSFMLSSGLLSMWISNTATAIMMLAIGMAIVSETESVFGLEKTQPLSLGIMLGIAYGCSIGGIATFVGTPTNLVFLGFFEETYPNAPPLAFGQWMLLGLPLSGIMLTITWLMLTRVFCKTSDDLILDSTIVDREQKALGPIRHSEVVVLTVFAITAFLWVFRKDLNVGVVQIPGWGNLLPFPDFVDDGTVAIAMALTLFLIPSRTGDPAAASTVLTMDVFGKIPWNLILLIGGGFALAEGFEVAGLSAFVGGKCGGLGGAPVIFMIAGVSATLTFLTELTSNVAAVQVILPILASVSQTIGVNPMLLMIPATLAASFAFMMPVATPPNAIVFASGRVRVIDMVRIGICLNLIGIVVITTLFFVLGTIVFSIDPAVIPEWAAMKAGG